MKMKTLVVKKAGNWFHVWNFLTQKSLTKFESHTAAERYIALLEGC